MKSLVFISPLILLLTIFHCSYADRQLIRQTCQNITDFQLCLATLDGDARSASATDARELARIVVDAVKKKTVEAVATVDRLKESAMPEEQMKAVQVCGEAYKAVLESGIPKAEQGLSFGNRELAEDGMANAAAAADACRDSAGKASVLGAVGQAVRSVIKLATSIVGKVL